LGLLTIFPFSKIHNGPFYI